MNQELYNSKEKKRKTLKHLIIIIKQRERRQKVSYDKRSNIEHLIHKLQFAKKERHGQYNSENHTVLQ
jgi:hypothetical protein